MERGTIRIRRSRLRPAYEHGCGGTCGRKPGFCPERRNTRPTTGRVKSRAGRRTVGLPAPLIELLRRHRTEQEAERANARQLWRDEGWLFASPTGGPTNPNTDYHEWKDLLSTAGLREARLHDARHTAATVLLVLGQPERTVMSLMGWSSAGMATRYQHVNDTIRAEVASQVGDLIWEARTEGGGEQMVSVRRESLATILLFAEDGLGRGDLDDDGLERLQKALIDLNTALAESSEEARGDAK